MTRLAAPMASARALAPDTTTQQSDPHTPWHDPRSIAPRPCAEEPVSDWTRDTAGLHRRPETDPAPLPGAPTLVVVRAEALEEADQAVPRHHRPVIDWRRRRSFDEVLDELEDAAREADGAETKCLRLGGGR